ncbi:MAG: hypothetical protein U0841_28375 [Chloroflexia bacterium]
MAGEWVLGAYQRELAPENAARFWRVLVRHGCWLTGAATSSRSTQVREGVLQITTAGAGTAHRMPEGVEYLHQHPGGARQGRVALPGARYRGAGARAVVVADRAAARWGMGGAGTGRQEAPVSGVGDEQLVAWEFSGVAAEVGGDAQTLLAAWGDGIGLATPWVGLLGQEQRLGVLINPAPGRSPSLWLGPALPPGRPFAVQLAIHGGWGRAASSGGGAMLRPGRRCAGHVAGRGAAGVAVAVGRGARSARGGGSAVSGMDLEWL